MAHVSKLPRGTIDEKVCSLSVHRLALAVMPDSFPAGSAHKRWSDIAAEYAEAFGWHVLPLHSNPDLASEADDDPVIRQLGWLPLVNVPDDASDQPDRVREWACYPTAPVAVLTGRRSNLTALEIPHTDGRAPLQDEIRRRLGLLPTTRRVVGPDRTYYLFSIPTGEDPLPSLTRRDGCVLHGDNSLIRVPSRPRSPYPQPFEWDLFAGEDLAALPATLRNRFDLPGNRTRHPGPTSKPSIQDTLPGGSLSASDSAALPDPDPAGAFPLQNREAGASSSGATPSVAPRRDSSSASRSEPKGSETPPCSLPFRNGEDLACCSDDIAGPLPFPWLAAGALTLLTGRPKTAGKSTFVLNLAVHIASGRPFLGRTLSAAPVVLLSDLPARPLRALLSQLDVSENARSRLHVLHPRAVANRGWAYVLDHTFRHADRVGAPLVIVDSLDTYIRAKGGPDPCCSDEVVHALTADGPADRAVLAVKSLPVNSFSGDDLPGPPGADAARNPTPASVPAELDLLGVTADVVAHLQEVSTSRYPTLRRLQIAGRLPALPSHLLCHMVRGRYERSRHYVPRDNVRIAESLASSLPDLTLSSADEGITEA